VTSESSKSSHHFFPRTKILTNSFVSLPSTTPIIILFKIEFDAYNTTNKTIALHHVNNNDRSSTKIIAAIIFVRLYVSKENVVIKITSQKIKGPVTVNSHRTILLGGGCKCECENKCEL